MRIIVLTISWVLLILQAVSFGQLRQAQTPNVSITKNRDFSPIRKKPTREQLLQLQPATEDLTSNATFLKQENTGIFRLLPDLGCAENALVVKVDDTCRNSVPDGSFYSFRADEHENEIRADIRLKEGFLISDGILTQGILVNLGDIPLENVSPNTAGFEYLNSYVPATSNKEAQKQFLQMTDGLRVGKYEYRKALQAVGQNTYGLRVIAYRGAYMHTFNGVPYNLLDGDKRVDITLAFRVIRIGQDGSVTILWKELLRKDAPKLKYVRPKKEEHLNG